MYTHAEREELFGSSSSSASEDERSVAPSEISLSSSGEEVEEADEEDKEQDDEEDESEEEDDEEDEDEDEKEEEEEKEEWEEEKPTYRLAQVRLLSHNHTCRPHTTAHAHVATHLLAVFVTCLGIE